MTIYKVRRGETVTDVEGFTALVQMAKDGELLPDDAVFVPASNRWHYARSIRQLREHFAQVEDPEPPPGKVREMTREMRESTNPAHDPTEATHVQDGDGTGGDVVPMRRGRWTPEGKGVQVPVFNYEIDLEPPPAAKPLRLLLFVGIGLALGSGIYVYMRGYARYLESEAQRAEALIAAGPLLTPARTPQPGQVSATRQQDEPDTPDRGTPKPVVTAGTPTPVPLPEFDSSGARSKVMNASVSPVTRTDQFARAVRTDLIKLAVPVRNVQLLAGKDKGKVKGPVPFDIVVEYSLGDDGSRATHAKHYWMILSMVGRRASELRLNLRAVTVKSFQGNKAVSSAVLSADLVKGVSGGSRSPDEVLAKFPDLAKP